MLIDFHSHTLPLADHGCKSVEVFLFQLEEAKRNGIDTVICTPHFYPHKDTVEKFLERKEDGLRQIAGKFDGVDFKVGAEVQLCIGLDKMQGLERLCIDGLDIMLIEMPSMLITDDFYETLRRLAKRFRIVIAHAERCSDLVIERLVEMGFMLQLDAESFTLFGMPRIKRILDSGLVYALGSDIHGKNKKAYPALVRAHKKCAGVNTRMRRLIYGE